MRSLLCLSALLIFAGCKDSRPKAREPEPAPVAEPDPMPTVEPAPLPVDMAIAPDALVDTAPDMAADAAPDMAVDAAPDMAVDAGPLVWPPENCVGVAIPPVPASPDGSEVCNYEDDDGDGLVDEGHAYVKQGSALAIPDALSNDSSRNHSMVATTVGYLATWRDYRGIHTTTLDRQGCVLTYGLLPTANPDRRTFSPFSHEIAYHAGRVAIVYSQQRAVEGGSGAFAAWLQLMTPQGELLGPPINLTPNRVSQGINEIIPFEDDKFAVFAITTNPVEYGMMYGTLMIIDRDGNVLERQTPFDGHRATIPYTSRGMNGLAYGDGHFALAWEGGVGILAVWSRDGQMRTLRGYNQEMRPDSGLVWTHRHFATAWMQARRLFGGTGVIVLFDPDGDEPEFSPANPTDDVEPTARKLLRTSGRGFNVVHPDLNEERLRSELKIWRLDELGEPIAPPVPIEVVTNAYTSGHHGPMAHFEWMPEGGTRIIFSGCEGDPQ